jgi:hypothetical protein
LKWINLGALDYLQSGLQHTRIVEMNLDELRDIDHALGGLFTVLAINLRMDSPIPGGKFSPGCR